MCLCTSYLENSIRLDEALTDDLQNQIGSGWVTNHWENSFTIGEIMQQNSTSNLVNGSCMSQSVQQSSAQFCPVLIAPKTSAYVSHEFQLTIHEPFLLIIVLLTLFLQKNDDGVHGITRGQECRCFRQHGFNGDSNFSCARNRVGLFRPIRCRSGSCSGRGRRQCCWNISRWLVA